MHASEVNRLKNEVRVADDLFQKDVKSKEEEFNKQKVTG
jgi:hypothetical protein